MSKHTYRAHKQITEKQDAPNPPAPTTNKGKADVIPQRRFLSDKLWSIFFPTVLFILFSLLALYYLPIRNADYLYACQEHSLWIDTKDFFNDLMRNVGGFTQWLGLYLTQYFYHPWTGSLFLILIWGLIFLLTMQTFKLKGFFSSLALLPCVLLLCSELCLGYWLYYLKMPGYWFTYSLAILFMMAFLYVGSLLKGYLRTAFVVLYVVVLYPVIGCWSLCGALCFLFIECADFISSYKEQSNKFKAIVRNCITWVLGIASVIIVPLVYYQHYSTLRQEEIWTIMLPDFEASRYSETTNNMLFVLVIVAFILFSIVGRFCHLFIDKLSSQETIKRRGTKSAFKRQLPWLTGSAAGVVLFIVYGAIVHSYEYHDDNFTAELRMYKCIEACDWKGALKESKKVKGPHTREMILFQNIALLHTGQVGDEMFKYENRTIPPSVKSKSKPDAIYRQDTIELRKNAKEKLESENIRRKKEGKDLVELTPDTLESCFQAEVKALNGDIFRDSLKVTICNTSGPLIYYNYGKCNFATRWCIENGVEFGFHVKEYKMMVRCAMMTGELHLAGKYLDILRHTTFHQDWAEEHLALLKDKAKYQKSKEFTCINPLYQTFNNALDGDQGIVELYLNNYFSHMSTKNPKFQDAGLAFALIQKDIPLFWQRFNNYANLHLNEPMPIHYQEAAYLFGQLEPGKVDISQMPFDKEKVVARYQKFMEKTQSLLQQYSAGHDQQWLLHHDKDLTQNVAKASFKEYGDTYWWFYYFSRGVHTY